MTESKLKCPVCNSNTFYSLENKVSPDFCSDDLYRIQLEGYLKSRKNNSVLNFDIAVCTSCQHLFKESFFSDSELEEIYRHEYLSQETKMESKEGFVYSNDYFLEVCSKHSYNLVDRINRTYETQIKKIFDIGGRDGFRLKDLAQNNFECHVFDPIQLKPCDKLIKKEYIFLDDIDEKNNSSDMIIFCHILEHCNNPVDVIAKCRNILNESGYIFIQVPFDIPLILEWLVLGKIRKKNLCNDITHAQFFTLGSLTALIESQGFVCLEADIEAQPITESGSKVLVINMIAQKTNVVKRHRIKPLRHFNILNATVIKFQTNRFSTHLNNKIILGCKGNKPDGLCGGGIT